MRGKRLRRAFGAALLLPFAALPGAAEIRLSPPVDCTLGETCFVQQYKDRDPGPGARDFTCGPLSYDTHDGTDFALPTLAAMEAGVAVLAPAPGTVTARRDGMPDIVATDPAAPPLEGRECGNGLILDHGGGWESQLCHLRRGSVLPAEGDRVARGAPVGQIGLSGRTEFPHLHLTLRRDGVPVDPFHPAPLAGCADTPQGALWDAPVPYRPGGIVGIGVAAEIPEYEAIKAGIAAAPPPADAPALVVWAHVFGGRAGDRVELALTGPEGEVFREALPLDRPQARLFRAAGRRLSGRAGWPPGEYRASAALIRDGAAIERMEQALRIGG